MKNPDSIPDETPSSKIKKIPKIVIENDSEENGPDEKSFIRSVSSISNWENESEKSFIMSVSSVSNRSECRENN